jgi:hypothetical protein
LPVFAAVADVPEVEVPAAVLVEVRELPPQAANTMHAATNATSHVKRFIDTLQFPSITSDQTRRPTAATSIRTGEQQLPGT